MSETRICDECGCEIESYDKVVMHDDNIYHEDCLAPAEEIFYFINGEYVSENDCKVGEATCVLEKGEYNE